MHAAMNALIPFASKASAIGRKEESTVSPRACIKRTLSELGQPCPKQQLNKRPKQQGKGVCIAEFANRYHDIESNDAEDCWLQDEDYDAIRRDTRATLKEIIVLRGKVSMMDEDRFCARGLEGSIAKIFGNNNYHMSNKFQSVLLRKQASDMKKFGAVDSVSLSHISARHSKHDRTRAAHLAQFDAKLS
ncbi:hypothetical protein MPSEU_000137300 [Mayamaea pseudoterrestris]|nr:hypothetical protein MPSEU_000137300 [Mayamaea pseudoterrestris]